MSAWIETLVDGDYIFSIKKDHNYFHLIVTKDEFVETGGTLGKGFIKRNGGEIIYTKIKGLKKSLTLSKFPSLRGQPRGGVTDYENLMNFGLIVNENIEEYRNRKRLLFKSQMNLFGTSRAPCERVD